MYLDTSVYVKLLTTEPDSEHYISLVENESTIVSSRLLIIELRSALRRKKLMGDISDDIEQDAWSYFLSQKEMGDIRLMPLNEGVLEEGQRVLEGVPDELQVRSLDAVHLGSCVYFRLFPLITADARMKAAAEYLRIPTK